MISADFYPTQTTQYTVEYTDTIDNLTYSDPETIAEPYYMGYVNWDDVPSLYHMSKINVVSDVTESYIEFEDITQTENIPWFFTGIYSNSSYSTSGTGIYIVDENNKYTRNSASTSVIYGFFNSLEIQRVGTYGRFSLYVSANLINTTVTPPTYTAESRTPLYDSIGNTTITWQQFLSFVNGDINLYTKIFTAPNESFEITFNDLLNGFCEFDYSNGNGKIQIYLTDYSLSYNSRDVQPNGGLAGWSRQNATFKMHANIDGENKPFLTNHMYWHSGYADEPYVLIANGTTVSHSIVGYTNTIIGGFNGRIPTTFFTNAVRDRWYVFGNFIVRRITSPNTYMQRIIPIMELLKYFAQLATRIGINNQNPAYGFSDIIAYPLFNDDNSPKWEYVTGLQEDIQDELQEWQYTNITANTFTEDDIPEYVPPSPEPEEDEESGTRIPNQFRYFTGANNFISQYAMKASQIQTFGQMLWNSWADSTTFVDAVNNFWIALNIEEFTGSFDISSVMDFIVSLKVFPFNITHFETSIFTLTDTLRIGRGTFPFLFPSEVGNIIKVLSNIVYVDCGLIHDPTTGQYGIPRKFNDFRDYTNVSITCFCPYCGTVELNPGDVVGRQLSCKYAVDLQSGECLCLITVADSTGDLYNVAAISGNMGAEIPVSATNSGLIQSRRLSDAGNALGLFGGMFTENMSMGSNTFARAKDSQSSIGAIASATSQAAGNLFKDIKQTSNFAANMLSRGAIGCPIMQGGSGFAAFSQADTPYVQIRYGIYSEPANYSHSVGRISTKSDTLSNYKDSGLVICENVDVSGFTCHEDERSEIKALLESGVYL